MFIETRSSSTRGEVREAFTTHIKLAAFYLYLHCIRRRVERDSIPYTDTALTAFEGAQRMTTASGREKKAVIAA